MSDHADPKSGSSAEPEEQGLPGLSSKGTSEGWTCFSWNKQYMSRFPWFMADLKGAQVPACGTSCCTQAGGAGEAAREAHWEGRNS